MTVYDVLAFGYLRPSGILGIGSSAGIQPHDGDKCYETLKGDSRGPRYGYAKVVCRPANGPYVHLEDAEDAANLLRAQGWTCWIDVATIPDPTPDPTTDEEAPREPRSLRERGWLT